LQRGEISILTLLGAGATARRDRARILVMLSMRSVMVSIIIFLRLQACAVLEWNVMSPPQIARIQFHVTGEQTRRIAIEDDVS
jgi:hypothetical protein